MRLFYLLLTSTLILIHCKNNTPINSHLTDATDLSLSEDDLGPLFNYYTLPPKTQQEKDENLIIEYLAEEQISAVRVGNGVYLDMITPGEGESIESHSRVTTHYEGAFLNGKVFDSSYRKNKPLTMRANQGVEGWRITLQQLRVGGKCVAYIPSTLGYGKRGYPPVIPAHTNLKFTIEVLGIEKRETR